MSISMGRLAVLASISIGACALPGRDSAEAPRELGLPQPTEHLLDDDAEKRHSRLRKQWIEEMHRTGPGVDWRAVERANGLAEQTRRNLLASSPAQAELWGEVGSANLAGRMHCAALGPDGASLYAGSSLGGLWRGNPDGNGWTPHGDNLYGGVHEVVALPGEQQPDPDVLVTTTDGGMVRLTRDLGATWETPSGLDPLIGVRGLAVLADAASTILVLGQRSSPWNTPALYRSTDYGRTFTRTWTTSSAGSASMWVPRAGPLAATHVFVAHVGKIRLSTDGGLTLPMILTIDTSSDAAVVTGSEAGAPKLYVALRSGGTWTLYASPDAGLSAAPMGVLGDFWENMAASILEPDTLIYGGVEAWRSIDGGASFARINSWGAYYNDPLVNLHADIMGVHVVPDPLVAGAEIWYLATDGGLYESRDAGQSVANLSLSGLGVSQYYSTHTAADDEEVIVAGAQDQGYQRGLYEPTGGPGAGPSTDFEQLISGDYGHLTSSDGTHDWLYSTYPGFILVQKNQYQPNLGTLSFPSGASNLWLPPVVADPLAKTSFFFCGDRLWRYDRTTGLNFTNTLHSAQVFSAGPSNYLTALAFAPGDPNRAYAVTDAGELFASSDHAVTWTKAASGAPAEHYFYGNALAVNPDDADEVVVAGSGYSGPGVLRSVDGGQTWLPEASGLPQTQVYDIAYARDQSGDLYCGTEQSAYRWDRLTGQWSGIALDQAPITIYWSVEAVGAHTLRFGTYGRGIWDYVLPDEGLGTLYCSAKPNSQNCLPTMTFSGTPSASAPTPYLAGAALVLNGKFGLLFYGHAPAANPFQGGTKCVASPVRRTEVQDSGGSPSGADCTGTYSYDLNARIQSGVDPSLVPGADVYAQYWYRDPQDPYTTGLTNALSFTIQP
jgi:photosystem II stability/assembly factor-like uncharacterized protein